MRKALLPYTMEIVANDAVFKSYVLRRQMKPQTVDIVAYALSRWCSHVNMMPSECISQAKQEQKTIEEVEDRNISKYFETFPEFMQSFTSNTKTGTVSESTMWQIQSNVKMFYERHRIELPDMRLKKGRPSRANRHFSDKDEIKKALSLCTNVRDRAIILCQCSSGMGTAELLSVTTEQFIKGYDKDSGVTTLELIRKKTGRPFITFLSPEASEQVLLWLENHDGEMLFPMSDIGITQMYNRINEKLGYKKEYGQFAQFRSHGMRRFFNNQMFDNGLGMHKDLIWFMSGRAENATQEGYIDKTVSELKEAYIEHVEKVSINVVRNITSEKVKNLETIVDKLQRKIDAMHTISLVEDDISRHLLFEMVKGNSKAFNEIKDENMKKTMIMIAKEYHDMYKEI